MTNFFAIEQKIIIISNPNMLSAFDFDNNIIEKQIEPTGILSYL